MSTPSSARTFVKVIAFISLCLGALSVLTSLLSIVRLELFPDQERGTLQGLLGVPIPPRFSWVLRIPWNSPWPMGRCHYCLSASVADCCISVNGRDVESCRCC